MDDFGYHRPIISNVCLPIWPTKSLCRSRKNLATPRFFNPSKCGDSRWKHSSSCWCITSRCLDTGTKTIPFVADILLLGVYISDEKTPSRVWHVVLGVWLPHKTLFLVFDVLITGIGNQMKLSYLMYDFVVFLYHTKHSCLCWYTTYLSGCSLSTSALAVSPSSLTVSE